MKDTTLLFLGGNPSFRTFAPKTLAFLRTFRIEQTERESLKITKPKKKRKEKGNSLSPKC